jgi:hypothetical protein
MRKKWTWKNGRLHHPTEPMSLSTTEAYYMVDKNDDVADACKGILSSFDANLENLSVHIIAALKIELSDYNKKKLEGQTDGK